MLAEFSAKILGGGLGRPFSAGRTTARWFGRPSRPAEPPPSFSAEDHRRASPPFHSDELDWATNTVPTDCMCVLLCECMFLRLMHPCPSLVSGPRNPKRACNAACACHSVHAVAPHSGHTQLQVQER